MSLHYYVIISLFLFPSLFDMGSEYYCYASDITCSFPSNGKFTPAQKMIYNVVLKTNRSVMAGVKPGVKWTDLNQLAERVLLAALRETGLLLGNLKDMMNAKMAAIFFPHSLGHFLGCDVIDVGGYPMVRPFNCESLCGAINIKVAYIICTHC